MKYIIIILVIITILACVEDTDTDTSVDLDSCPGCILIATDTPATSIIVIE